MILRKKKKIALLKAFRKTSKLWYLGLNMCMKKYSYKKSSYRVGFFIILYERLKKNSFNFGLTEINVLHWNNSSAAILITNSSEIKT